MNRKALKFLTLMLMLVVFMVSFSVCASASNLISTSESVTMDGEVELIPNDSEEGSENESEFDFAISDYPVDDSADVGLLGVNPNIYTESTLNGNFNGVDNNPLYFEGIYPQSSLLALGNCTRGYLSLQGGCFDGQYYYFAFLNKLNQDVEIDTFISCFEKNSSGDFVHVATKSGLHSMLRHANDMTYNPDTQEIVISCGNKNYENKIYTVKAVDLRSSGTPTFTLHYVSAKVSGIEYNATRGQYVAKIGGYLNGFAILDNDFNLIKYVGYENDASSGWVNQGITADNQYVYLLHFNEDTPYSEYCNRIIVFDWNGTYKKTIRLNIANAGVERIYECENIMIVNDKLQVGFTGMMSGANRGFYTLDLSSLTYHIQYCPDENVSQYKYQYNNTNVKSVMVGGISMPLRKFRVEKTNCEFVGWTAYRCEEDKWLYEVPNASGGVTLTWLKADSASAAGLKKYIYADKQNVSQTTANGKHVLMCAQWRDTDYFFVKFIGNGGKTSANKTEYDFAVQHGKATALPANQFFKSNRSFQHWNAYWAERNMWYYINSDTNQKKWFKEGYQEPGYVKYEYQDGQSVVQTAHKGGHIYMYAVWNEYTVYYDAGGALISKENIIESDKFVYNPDLTTLKNYFETYDASNILLYSPATQGLENVQLSGYTLYRPDEDKSMYVDPDGTLKWLPGRAPSCVVNGIHYTLYERVITNDNYLGSTATPGETLILTAVWD